MTEGKHALLATIIIVIFVVGASAGFLIASITYEQKVAELESQLERLRVAVSSAATNINASAPSVLLPHNISLSELYNKVKDSVVVVRALVGSSLEYSTIAEGSGFVYNYNGHMVIITNYHVVHGAISISVTFSNGHGYPATVIGADPYVDIAVLSVKAPMHEFKPLKVVNSSNLRVGDIVIAIGNPFGLTGSMSIGIISGLGRTITEELTGGYPIANVIQITAPINPGNSGGPLLNLNGEVIGVTTAIISEAQGVGFAVPSNVILREIGDLITKGYYDKHPWLGIMCTDMTYEIAKVMGVNVTYGCLIVKVIKEGPAFKAGLRGGYKEAVVAGKKILIGGDIIIAINGKVIKDVSDLAAYLEEHTKPGQVITVTIVRENRVLTIEVKLEARPPAKLP